MLNLSSEVDLEVIDLIILNHIEEADIPIVGADAILPSFVIATATTLSL